jgi:hypothetical protein
MTSLIPTVTGTPMNDDLLSAKPIWWASIFEQANGPYTAGDILGLIEEGVVHAESLMWRDPWPHWNRVCESDELLWAWERALLCDLETPHFDVDIDTEAPFLDPDGWENLDTDTRMMLAGAGQPKVVVKPRGLKPVGVRRSDHIGTARSIVTLGLTLAAGTAAWASQLQLGV